ncbi:uncharacterized protein [Lolium perenne]|uniref:uncharacterized protein n=1 Tax=Lolium perenne TaxID=4522 RepID=UPI0021EA0B83|nr:uncharacterized protein LOC127301138 [Lolium perenne]
MSRPHLPANPRANGLFDGAGRRLCEIEEAAAAVAAAEQSWSGSPSQSQSTSPSSASSLPMSSCGQYMLHRVGKFDTLAGVAIKYGVEVADIKRLNSLSTDLQMFGHKTLRIPLPGRHPPSPFQHNGSYDGDDREYTPRRLHEDLLDSVLRTPRHKVSPAMSLLQGYYGLTPPPKRDPTHEGTEMSIYGKGKSVSLVDEPWSAETPNPNKFLFEHRNARSPTIGSVVNGESEENGDSERPVRRNQKADGELLLREENGSALLSRAGKGLALRPKAGSRADMNKSHQNLIAMMEPSFDDGLQTVKKSSSTPEFQEPESKNSSSSIWSASKWSLKPDGFTLPLFDSIPKPISAWKNKAARD